MGSPTPDIDPDKIRPPLPCSRYPQCRQECTWPACNEKEAHMPNVPDTAAQWIANALADPEAPNGTITFRSARAVFELVRRFDATGRSGWESHEERQQ